MTIVGMLEKQIEMGIYTHILLVHMCILCVYTRVCVCICIRMYISSSEIDSKMEKSAVHSCHAFPGLSPRSLLPQKGGLVLLERDAVFISLSPSLKISKEYSSWTEASVIVPHRRERSTLSVSFSNPGQAVPHIPPVCASQDYSGWELRLLCLCPTETELHIF